MRRDLALPLAIVAILLAAVIVASYVSRSTVEPTESPVAEPDPNMITEPTEPPIEEPEPQTTVRLYYYDPAKDSDETGNVMCSRNGLVPVERTVSADATPTDVVRMLLAGDLLPEERAQGVTTEYPLDGFSLVSGELEDGTLTLSFDDPEGKSVGGSCRVGILWMQIEATAMQFSEVREVRFLPEEIFQP